MKRIVLWGALAFLAAAPLSAQRPWTFGVAGGLSVPTGRLDQSVNSGWHIAGSAALGSLMQPLGVRAELSVHRLGFEAPVVGVQHWTTALTLNGTYRPPMTDSPWSPYLIAGLGLYHVRCTPGGSCNDNTGLGWNAGAGVKANVMGLQAFLETRYHAARGGPKFVPITVGVLF